MSHSGAPGIRSTELASLGTVLVLAAAGCSSPTITSTDAAGTPLPTFARNPAPIVEGEPYVQTIDPAMFVDGVDHPFFPMVAGSTFVFKGDEHVEIKVLDERKTILGVPATVVSDRVLVNGELTEDTHDWYAQDRQGNVWYFGEETAEYQNGQVSSTAGSWEAGVDGAQPGIIMLADPQVGDTYRQEFYAGEAEDLAEVTAISGEISSTAGSWSGSDVLVTEEWTPLEPAIRERKTYARGVGLVETQMIKGGKEKTSLTEAHVGPTGTGPSGLRAALGPSDLAVAFVIAAPLLGIGFGARHRRQRPGVRSRRKRAREARGPRCRGSFEGRCCRRAGPATRSR